LKDSRTLKSGYFRVTRFFAAKSTARLAILSSFLTTEVERWKARQSRTEIGGLRRFFHFPNAIAADFNMQADCPSKVLTAT